MYNVWRRDSPVYSFSCFRLINNLKIYLNILKYTYIRNSLHNLEGNNIYFSGFGLTISNYDLLSPVGHK